MKPVGCKGLWKYEWESIRDFREGASLSYDYNADSNPSIEKIQNRLRIRGMKTLPQAERVNVIFPQSDIGGNTDSIRWVPMKTTTTIDDPGGIDANDTSIIVLKPAGALFTPNPLRIAAVQIDDEYIVIKSVTPSTPDGSHDTWTVVRGAHGTSPAAHADGSECRPYFANPDMGVIALSSSNVTLDVPTNLVADGFQGFIELSWDHNLDEDEFKQLEAFILYYSDATIANFDPNVDPVPGGVTRLELSKSPGYIFSDATYVEKFFRVTAMNRSGVESALSSEDSATATQPATSVVNAKPDPPLVGFGANGGSEATGYFFTCKAQVSGSAGDAGVTKLEFQIGNPSANFSASTGFDSITQFVDGSEAKWELGGTIGQVEVAVPRSSVVAGGPYQFTARVFNAAGGGWSDYASPSSASTAAGDPDGDVAKNDGSSIELVDAPQHLQALGAAVLAKLKIPVTNNLGIYGVEIQCVSDLADWSENLEDTLGLTLNLSGLTCDVVQGLAQATNVSPPLTAGAHVGKVAYFYDSAIVSGTDAGEVLGEYALLISANGTDTLTIQSGNPPAFPRTLNGKKLAIGPSNGWKNYLYREEVVTLQPSSHQSGAQGNPFIFIGFPISKPFYFRRRWMHTRGRGPWAYWDSGSSDGITTTKANADQFTPSKMVANAVIQDGTILSAQIGADQIDNTHLSENAVQALQLAEELRPPTVGTGDPSGSPGAGEGDWYYRTDAPAGDSPFWFWKGSPSFVWTNDPDQFPEDVMAVSGIITGYVAAAAIRTTAAIVDGILIADHIVAGGLDMLPGQDIHFPLADVDPSEIAWGTSGGDRLHIFAQNDSLASFINPQGNGGVLRIGGTSAHWGEEAWASIEMLSKDLGAEILFTAIDSADSDKFSQLQLSKVLGSNLFYGWDSGTPQVASVLLDSTSVRINHAGVTAAEFDNSLAQFATDAYFAQSVGIGTAGPQSILHARETSARNGEILIQSTFAAGYDAQLSLENTHTGGRKYELLSTNSSRGVLGGGKFAVIDRTAGDSAHRLVIDSTGKVGIGTLPGAQLDIAISAATNIGLIVEGFTAQTADLLQVNTVGVTTGDRLRLTAAGLLIAPVQGLVGAAASSVISSARNLVANAGLAVQANATANSIYLSITTTTTDCSIDFNKVGTATVDELFFKHGGVTWLTVDGTLLTFSEDCLFSQPIVGDLTVEADIFCTGEVTLKNGSTITGGLSAPGTGVLSLEGVSGKQVQVVATTADLVLTTILGGDVLIDHGPNDDFILNQGSLTLRERSTPPTKLGYGKIYTKSDNKLYFKDGAGTEHEIAFV